MSLLTTMLERPLDPGYAAAADRREAEGRPRSTSLRSPGLVIATVLIGLVFGVASYNLTVANEPRSQARANLIAQILERRSQVDALTAKATTLQGQLTAVEADQLGSDALTSQTRELSMAVGTLAMDGPGFTLTMDDAPGAGADDAATAAGQAQQGRVLAKDLQYVTNAMWQAGAEAVSINGKRLTATSAIRFAGSALVVDYRPLTTLRPHRPGRPQALPGDLRRRGRGHLPVHVAQHVRHPGRHRGLRRADRAGRGGSDDAVRAQRGYWGRNRVTRHHRVADHQLRRGALS